eukprot:1392164-Amorphochlora_amoeboformis.AAC.2
MAEKLHLFTKTHGHLSSDQAILMRETILDIVANFHVALTPSDQRRNPMCFRRQWFGREGKFKGMPFNFTLQAEPSQSEKREDLQADWRELNRLRTLHAARYTGNHSAREHLRPHLATPIPGSDPTSNPARHCAQSCDQKVSPQPSPTPVLLRKPQRRSSKWEAVATATKRVPPPPMIRPSRANFAVVEKRGNAGVIRVKSEKGWRVMKQEVTGVRDRAFSGDFLFAGCLLES